MKETFSRLSFIDKFKATEEIKSGQEATELVDPLQVWGEENPEQLHLVNYSKFFETYRSEMVFNLEDLQAIPYTSAYIGDILVDYKNASEAGSMRKIHQDLLRADLYFASSERLYCGLAEAIEKQIEITKPSSFKLRTSDWHSKCSKILFKVAVNLWGERYINNQQADMFLRKSAQELINQRPHLPASELQSKIGFLPMDQFLPTPLLITRYWLASRHIRMIEQLGVDGGLNKISREVYQWTKIARKFLLQNGLIENDLINNQPESIGEVYQRLDPLKFDQVYPQEIHP